MNLTSVIITSSETFSLILLISKVSVVIVISKTFKFEKRSQFYSVISFFRPRAFYASLYKLLKTFINSSPKSLIEM